jgi:hypothetical protein
MLARRSITTTIVAAVKRRVVLATACRQIAGMAVRFADVVSADRRRAYAAELCETPFRQLLIQAYNDGEDSPSDPDEQYALEQYVDWNEVAAPYVDEAIAKADA